MQQQLTETSSTSKYNLDSFFETHGWTRDNQTSDFTSYYKRGHELDTFDIKLECNKFAITIPLKNIQYKITFDSYVNASDYIIRRFQDFTLFE